MKQKLVVLTGAGISAESGFSTFRDSDGLWERYPVEAVATPEGWQADPNLVTDFYNSLRRQLLTAQPNAAHLALAQLEQHYDVTVVTQNVDDLHERAGSRNVLHLHGELMKVRALDDESRVYSLPQALEGSEDPLSTTVDTVIQGHHVRPHIVFFQEAVPNFEPAVQLVEEADIFVVIGTSLNVYPAAALLHYVRRGVPVYYIDPNPASVPANVHVIRAGASEGMAELSRILLQNP